MSRPLAFRLSRHAEERRVEMRLSPADVLHVLNHPDVDRPAGQGHPERRMACGEMLGGVRLSVVYSPTTLTVVTILPWITEQYQRGN